MVRGSIEGKYPDVKHFVALVVITGLVAAASGAEAGAPRPRGLSPLDREPSPFAGEETATHPTLFFTRADVEALRDKCATATSRQYDAILAYAEAHLADVPPALSGDYEERGLAIEHPYLTNILDFSFLALLTGDARFVEAAKRWTLALASMDMWAGPVSPRDKEADRGLYAGFGLTALACAYDWLYDDLSAEERAAVRAKTAKIAEGIYRATRGGEWWSGAYLHHDLWIPVAGMGLASIAIAGETPAARDWAAQAESEFFQVMNRLGDEGAWHEGVCGWAFGMASLCPFLDAYTRAYGSRLGERPWLKNTWAFRLYSRVPTGEFVTFGDGRPNGAYQWTAWEAAPTLRLLARTYANPYAQWLAEREWETRPNPYTAVWEIIWTDTSIASTPPDALPVSAVFANQGLALMRTGWRADATVAAFRSDSLVGQQGAKYFASGDTRMNVSVDHAHADANAFVVWSRGAYAIEQADYGQRDTEFENSILVDGKGQYRSFDAKDRPGRPAGGLTRFFQSRYATFATGDAARCYPAGLDAYDRTIYLVQPGIVFLVDRVATQKGAGVEWLFHVDKAAKLLSAPDMVLARARGLDTRIAFARPAEMAYVARDDRNNTGIAAKAASGAPPARLVTAIVPSTASDAKVVVESPAPGVFTVDALAGKTVAVFPAATGGIDAAGLEGNGSSAVATRDGAACGFLAADSTSLAIDGETLLASPVPVTAACWVDADGGWLTISTKEPTQVAVNPRMSVGEVTVGGRPAPYITDGPRIIINVPSGTRTYALIPADGEAKAAARELGPIRITIVAATARDREGRSWNPAGRMKRSRRRFRAAGGQLRRSDPSVVTVSSC